MNEKIAYALLESKFNWYGFLIGGGMVLCIVLAYFAAKKRGYYKDLVFDIAIICIPLAIVGARLYYVLFDIIGGGGNWTFLKIIGFENGEFSLSGLAIYGGLIFAVLGGLIIHFWKRKKKPVNESINFLQLLDLGFTFIILGQCVGRWGNFANLEAFGPQVDFDFFPLSVFIPAAKNPISGEGFYMATFFYESLWNFIGFLFLYKLYTGKRKSFDGFNVACYLVYEGIGRAWIEALRTDSLYAGNLKISQIISLLMIPLGIGIIIAHLYKARENGKKPFIFVEQSKLNDSYYGYTSSILHHPCDYTVKPTKTAEDFSDEFYAEPDEGFETVEAVVDADDSSDGDGGFY